MPNSSERSKVELILEQIPSVSPSLAESLRICPLQAMLNRSRELRQFTLESPKAWLVITYHEVLEKLWSNERPDLDDELMDHLWESAVERVRQASADHPLDRRFSEHEGCGLVTTLAGGPCPSLSTYCFYVQVSPIQFCGMCANSRGQLEILVCQESTS